MGARDAHASHRLGDLRHWGRQARTRGPHLRLLPRARARPARYGRLPSSPNNIAVVGAAPGRRAPAANQSRTFHGHARKQRVPRAYSCGLYYAIRRDSLGESDVVASPSSSRGSPSGLRARSPRPAVPTTSRLALGSLFFPTHPPCPRGRQARTWGPHLRLLPGPVRGRPATLACLPPPALVGEPRPQTRAGSCTDTRRKQRVPRACSCGTLDAIRRDSLGEIDVIASPCSSLGSPRGLCARSPRPAAPSTSRLALGSLFLFPPTDPVHGAPSADPGPHLRLLPGPVRGRPATLACLPPPTTRGGRGRAGRRAPAANQSRILHASARTRRKQRVPRACSCGLLLCDPT